MDTINYVAPEIMDFTPYNHKANVRSLGVILYFLLGGILPFDDENMDEAVIGKKIVYRESILKSIYLIDLMVVSLYQ